MPHNDPHWGGTAAPSGRGASLGQMRVERRRLRLGGEALALVVGSGLHVDHKVTEQGPLSAHRAKGMSLALGVKLGGRQRVDPAVDGADRGAGLVGELRHEVGLVDRKTVQSLR